MLILAVTAILVFGIAPFTLAWLMDSESVENKFEPGTVTLAISEDFDGFTKQNVTFQNTGNTPAFIRVTLVPVWRDGTYNSGLTTAGTYDITLGSGWTLSGGYYYYNSPVPAGGSTAALIVSCSPKAGLTAANPEYEGMRFEMQVIASALQADGWNAATDTAIEAFATAKDTNNKEF